MNAPQTLHPTLAPFDQAEILPPIGAEKLRRLRDKPAVSHSILRTTADRMAVEREKLQEAETRIRFLRAPPTGKAVGDDNPSMAAAIKQRDAAKAELARLQPIYDAQSAIWSMHGNLAREIETWVASRPGKLVDHDFETPALRKGEDLLGAIEARRRRGRDLAADLHQVQSAPILSSVAKAKMRKQIEEAAELGMPNVGSMIEFGEPVEFQKTTHRAVAQGEKLAYVGMTTPDAMALTIWLHKDALIKKLEAAIDDEADDAAALSDEDRAKKIATITADMLATAREECALVWQAQEQGLPAEHRIDADPLALLGVIEVERDAVDMTQSSPQHAARETVMANGGRGAKRGPGPTTAEIAASFGAPPPVPGR